MAFSSTLVYIVLANLIQFCSLSGVSGTLYPTKPISSTSYSAGRPAEVKWMEDGSKPFLNATGVFKIDLYAGNNTYLATIATGIDPTLLSTTVFIPSKIPKNSLCTLRFITTEPPQTIYTADFSVIPDPSGESNASSTVTTTSHSSSASVKTVTSTVYSRIYDTQAASPSATPTQTRNAAIGMPWGMRGRNGHTGLFTLDAEKMKFRIVFIVWPALVGLSMAL